MAEHEDNTQERGLAADCGIRENGSMDVSVKHEKTDIVSDITDCYCKIRAWHGAEPFENDFELKKHLGRICHEIDELLDLIDSRGSDVPATGRGIFRSGTNDDAEILLNAIEGTVKNACQWQALLIPGELSVVVKWQKQSS